MTDLDLRPAEASPAGDPGGGRRGVLPVAVLGLGAHLPERVVANDELPASLETSDEWIRTRTGIRQRHVADPATATSDLALAAARVALADAGLDAQQLAAVVVATSTPDYRLPATAPQVTAGLGIETGAYDVGAACAGFLPGLKVAALHALADDAPVLLVGAEVMTRIVDPTDRSIAVLFGDGAGAVVLAPDDGAELGPFVLGSDGSVLEALYAPGGGSREPLTPETLDRGYLTMRGREVYRHAVTRMAAASTEVLDRSGLDASDVDLLVGHQANARILSAVASRVGIAEERCHVTVDRHANTSAASIPLALADARAAGRLDPGARVLVTAFGAGLTWGAALLRGRP